MILCCLALVLLPTTGAPSSGARSVRKVAITIAVPGTQGSTATDVKDVSSSTIRSYQLPPDLYRKARNRGRINFATQLLDWIYGFAIFWILLHARVAVRFRDW